MSSTADVQVRWVEDWSFDTGRPGRPQARLDGRGTSGQSPVDALLSALATCIGIDVVEILAKRKTPVTSLSVQVVGQRAETFPRRFTHITLAFVVGGEGIEQDQAERAVDLSMTKYCSVRASLAADIQIDWSLRLE